jgi:hypothetical protein
MPKAGAAVAVDSDNPFIFTPMRFQKSQYAPPVVAKGDLVTFKAYLANPFAFQVHLESVSLATEGADFDAYPVLAVTLQPHAVCHEVVLCGKALSAGSVRAKGCLIHALNILCLHAVDGRGLPVVHTDPADVTSAHPPLVSEPPKVPETRNLPREDGPENATEVLYSCVLLTFERERKTNLTARCTRSPGGRGGGGPTAHAIYSRAAHSSAGI